MAAAGRLVCAIGANDPRQRELDNVVLERAAFVCCDSLEQARLESGDLIEPVEAGVLDWLEVHQLQEVVAGELPGRQADEDIVLFKSNGLAAWDVAIGAVALERAREQRRRHAGLGALQRAALRESAGRAASRRRPAPPRRGTPSRVPTVAAIAPAADRPTGTSTNEPSAS